MSKIVMLCFCNKFVNSIKKYNLIQGEKMSIKIIADSTCDLSQEIIEKYNISVAPLIVHIDGEEYRDKIDIKTDEFYNKLETFKTPPTTSMPSPDSYIQCIKDAEQK